jgi:hypothetical protein
MPPLRDPDDRWLAAARSGDAEPEDDPDDLAIRRLGAVARSLDDDDFALEAPPPSVWSSIAAAVEADGAGRDADGPAGPTAAPPVTGHVAGNGFADASGHRPGAGQVGAAPVDPAPPAPPAPPAGAPTPPLDPAPPAAPPLPGAPAAPVDLGRARAARAGRPRWLVAAAAAAVVLVVGVAVALVTGGDGGTSGEVVATAVLEPLQPGDAAPEAVPAELVRSDAGARLDVAIDTAALPDDAGYYEVWLIDTAVDGMVSLGPVREDGTYDVPAGVDPGLFPIVDVSAEPTDGDPTHSGTSVLRGTLA